MHLNLRGKSHPLLWPRMLQATSALTLAVRLVPSIGLPKDPLELGGWILVLVKDVEIAGWCVDVVKS